MSPGRRLAFLVLGVFLFLSATAEERTFGTVTDEQQMLDTAVSIAEGGEIGIGRGAIFTIARPGGDAVSPYGMGLPLLEVPAALLSGSWERAFGPRSSQTLFVLLQIALVTAAAAGAGLLARTLGADAGGETLAVLGAAAASPLAAYTASGYSEPLQAAALVLSLLGAASAVREGSGSWRPAAAAGFLAGYAVLTKGSNLLLLPVLLLPIVLDAGATAGKRIRLAAAWAAGTVPTLSAWLAFEVVRFGRPFASYGSQRFTHPPLDGLWRLLVGLNKGLVWYFPLSLLSAFAVARLLARRETRSSALAIAGTFGALLFLASAWWAWDGTVGWGPRLLVPAIPLLSAAAGAAVAAHPRLRPPAFTLLAAGVTVNLLGLLQPEAVAYAYVSAAGPSPVTEIEARAYPPYFVEPLPNGGRGVSRDFTAASDAAFSPLRVHAFLLRQRLTDSGPEDRRRELSAAPWLGAHPEAVPELHLPPGTMKALLIENAVVPFAWHHLLQASTAGSEERTATFNGAWDNALTGQVYRNLDIGRPERAVPLAARLYELTPSGLTAALQVESLRAAGRLPELTDFLRSLPERHAASPLVALVEALRARDRGDEEGARAALARAARLVRTPEIARALAGPLSAWPKGLHGFLAGKL